MDIDDLYALPLTEFVAARGALAKEVRGAGDRDGAAQIAALRKPSVAAWAVNQVVRGAGDGLAELVAAGDAVADAQAALVGGGDRAVMREATKALRTVIGRLVAAAGGLDGVGAGAVEHVRETFKAAAVDPDAREAVLGGRLERELRYSGIGVGAGGSATPARPPAKAKSTAEPEPVPRTRTQGAAKSARKRTGPGRSRGDEGAQVAAEAREAEEDRQAEAARAAEAARKAEEAAERERVAKARKAAEKTLAAAARAVGKARDRRDRAAAALEDADVDLARAQAEHDAATTALAHLDAV